VNATTKLPARVRAALVEIAGSGCTLGLLIAVWVAAAAADDGTSAPEILSRLKAEHASRSELVWADSKYRQTPILKSWDRHDRN
jgi:hypothetical protein